jgi:neutral ceramidase
MMKRVRAQVALLALLLSLALGKVAIPVTEQDAGSQEYMVGVGKADVTGPAAEVGMMGYAMPGQRTAGIHTRLWSRAFVVSHPATGGLVAYVSTDVCMVMQAVKLTVITELEKILGPNVFTNDNVVLSGIHTHSGPGGFSWYALYDISDLGYDDQNFRAVVNGIASAIVTAYHNMKPSSIFANVDSPLLNSNINRSPTAYLANPPAERALYPEGDTDKNMTLIKMVDANGDGMGSIAWFPVHCTSMNNTNHLISSDNKGYASYLFEKSMASNSSTLFKDIPFVAAFGQANEGDVSPNTKGPHCPDGSPCASDSTCNGKNEQCIAPGPGVDMFDSTRIIGTNQFNKAQELYQTAKEQITGPINFRHMFINMTNYIVNGNFTHNGQPAHTCRGAMGYSFAAGTTDGPGAFDFTQGNNNTNGNPFWNFISSFLAKPTPDQIECQSPKPILLDVGQIEPIPWAPDVVAVQIVTLGQLVIVAVPGEFTTMSGRRLRNTIREVFVQGGMENPIVVISGLSNTYSGYIATYEEYIVQRYEGASTIFGPHTLGAYQQIYSQLAESIIMNTTLPAGATPRNLSEHQISFIPPVIVDMAPIGKHFGALHQDAQSAYSVGDLVEVIFYGANLRNNLMTGDSFLYVQQMDPNTQSWNTVLTDADWDTRIYWARHNLAESLITITWNITSEIEPGKYRIIHNGYAKHDPISGKVTPYSGSTSVFAVGN